MKEVLIDVWHNQRECVKQISQQVDMMWTWQISMRKGGANPRWNPLVDGYADLNMGKNGLGLLYGKISNLM